MKITIMTKGVYETSEHVLICDKNELLVITEVFTSYCNENKRKTKSKEHVKII